ncbi:MAG TPA: peptidoglycan editing factor PgeF [Acidobacteriota bacterium]|nr:peptidoglycan editing factor PgeF [Acidobacteriota bacterium]
MFKNKIVARHHVFTFTELEQIPGFVHLVVGRPSVPKELDAEASEKVAYLPPDEVLTAATIGEFLMVPLQQIHSDRTIVLDGSSNRAGPLQEADGVIALRAEVCPVIRTADCVPVIAVASQQRALGIFHAGWRGTCSRIVEKGILRLLQASGASPEDVVVAFGPAIRKCCYEVGTEVEAEFRKEGHEIERFINDKHLDLLEANRLQLLSLGINRILDSGLCTACHPKLLYSYRRDRTSNRIWTIAGFRS